MPKGINWNEQFYKLLRLSLGLTQEFLYSIIAHGHNHKYDDLVPLFVVLQVHQRFRHANNN